MVVADAGGQPGEQFRVDEVAAVALLGSGLRVRGLQGEGSHGVLLMGSAASARGGVDTRADAGREGGGA
jgi:hypothetical protein